MLPAVLPVLAAAARRECPLVPPLPPVRYREEIGGLLFDLGLSGPGVELGVQRGYFTGDLLNGWRRPPVGSGATPL